MDLSTLFGVAGMAALVAGVVGARMLANAVAKRLDRGRRGSGGDRYWGTSTGDQGRDNIADKIGNPYTWNGGS